MQDGELGVDWRTRTASAGLVVTLSVIAAGLVVGPFAQGPERAGEATGPVDRVSAAGRVTTATEPPTWDELRTLSRPDQTAPSLTLAADGGLAAAYSDSMRATYRQQDEGGAWPLTHSIASSGFAPAIGSDAGGTVRAVWATGAGSGAAVVAADRAPDGTWSSPQVLAAAVDPFALGIEVNSVGAAVATWLEAPAGDRASLRAAYRPAGGSWTSATTLAEPRLRPVTTLSPGGTATITYDGPDGHLTAVRRTPTRWLAPVPHPDAEDLRSFDADLGQPNTLVAVWESQDGDHATARFVEGVWRSSTRLEGPDGPSAGLQVAAARDGSSLVVWGTEADGEPAGVRGVRLTEDGAGESTEILDDGGPRCGSLRLVGNDRGDAAAVWMSSSGGGPSEASVQVAYWMRDTGSWLAPFRASGDRGARLCPDPALTVSDEGAVAVAWKAPAGRILVRGTVPVG